MQTSSTWMQGRMWTEEVASSFRWWPSVGKKKKKEGERDRGERVAATDGEGKRGEGLCPRPDR